MACGPSEEQIRGWIAEQPGPTSMPTGTLQPVPTPQPTATPMVFPTPLPTATPTMLIQGAEGPKGDKGDKGDTGGQGAPGAPGAPGSLNISLADFVQKDLDAEAVQEHIGITTDGVVHVRSQRGAGTGFVIRVADGFAYVLTANHVLSGNTRNHADKNGQYQVGNKSVTSIALQNASLVYSSSNYDLASLKFPCADCKPLAISTQTMRDSLNQFCEDGIAGGHEVVTVSYGDWLEGTEIVNGTTIEDSCFGNAPEDITHDTYLLSGDSGSPLLNTDGYVVGINLRAEGVSKALYLVDEPWNKAVQNVLLRCMGIGR